MEVEQNLEKDVVDNEVATDQEFIIKKEVDMNENKVIPEVDSLRQKYAEAQQALEQNQDEKKKKKLTQQTNKTRKALEKYLAEQKLPTLPVEIWKAEEDTDTIVIEKTMQDLIIGFPVNGMTTTSGEIETALSLIQDECFEQNTLKVFAPAQIFYDADIELHDLNGNTIPKGTGNVCCPASDAKTNAIIRATHQLNMRTTIEGQGTIPLRNIQIKAFATIKEYGKYLGINNLPDRKLKLKEQAGISKMVNPTEFITEVNKTIAEYKLPAQIAIKLHNNGNLISSKELMGIMRGKINENSQYDTDLGREIIGTINTKFGSEAYKGYPFKALLKFATTFTDAGEQVGLKETHELLKTFTDDDLERIRKQKEAKSEMIFSILAGKQQSPVSSDIE